MFLLTFVVFSSPSLAHSSTYDFLFQPPRPSYPPPPPPPKSFQSPILYQKKKEKEEEICERFGMNTKKQDSVFMELSSSIDFYMPCSLVTLTYVKTVKLLTPTHTHTHPLHKDTPSCYRGCFTVACELQDPFCPLAYAGS
jgi:hypothetical protein